MEYQKVFDLRGEYVIRFAKDDVEGIESFVGLVYAIARRFGVLVECHVFGEALEFRCRVEEK
jgi:hypothetical protein